jgi:hypothetical protein
MAQADPNRILRLLPLFAGIVGGTVLMFNRFATADLTPSPLTGCCGINRARRPGICPRFARTG